MYLIMKTIVRVDNRLYQLMVYYYVNSMCVQFSAFRVSRIHTCVGQASKRDREEKFSIKNNCWVCYKSEIMLIEFDAFY